MQTVSNKTGYCETMQFTGERMVPDATEVASVTFWEHIYRYKFACNYVVGKRVLDIACGEGYGTAAMARAGATEVVGVDISEETCVHAKRKYGVDARVGDAQAIPLADASVDLVVSFETLEHVDSPELFVKECVRVLAPGGIIILSTPNKGIYRKDDEPNPFHCSELSDEEFSRLVAAHFRSYEMYMQSIDQIKRSSLVSLCAYENPWKNIRGMNRLRMSLRNRLSGHVEGELAENVRQNPLDVILTKDSYLSRFVNPYAVQKYIKRHAPLPQYLIAIATK